MEKSLKRIGIMSTGGDCSGLNSVINRLVYSGLSRGHKMFGILDGTDGLSMPKPEIIELNYKTIPPEYMRLSGSFLKNGNPNALNYRTDKTGQFQKNMKAAILKLKLDAIILIGGNGSLSLANTHASDYSSIQLVCIPKTIDMDIPETDITLGFSTAVNELVKYADQLLLTARSHHRWFIVQTMGRDSGFLCLHSGLAAGARAILIPESKWKLPKLMEHIKKEPLDYGLIFVAEGCTIRGRSGKVSDIIERDFTKAGISCRAVFPEHLQRVGDTVATDRIVSAEFAVCALDAIENNETMVMVTKKQGIIKTISLQNVVVSGIIVEDPNIKGFFMSNEYVSEKDPLLKVAKDLKIFI